MADFLMFVEGRDELTANGLPSTCRFDLSTHAIGPGGLEAGATFTGGYGVQAGTGYAAQSQAEPTPVAGQVTFTQMSWDSGTATDWSSVASVVLRTSTKLICAWHLESGGAARGMPAHTIARAVPRFKVLSAGDAIDEQSHSPVGGITITGTRVEFWTPPPTGTFIEGSDAPGADGVIAAMWGGPQSGSWLTTRLPDNVALDPLTVEAVAELVRQVNTYAPWINGVSDNTWTSTINVVPDDTPMVPITPKASSLQSYAANLRTVYAAGFPIPAGLLPSSDYDAELVLIQHGFSRTLGTSTYQGRMYEMYAARDPSTSASGNWEASWGGRYINTRNNKLGHWYDKWWNPPTGYDQSPFGVNGLGMDHNWGAQATSIPLSHTIITRRDIRRGVIDHPLGFLSSPAPVAEQVQFVWPAMRRDSGSRGRIINGVLQPVMPHGSRFRLPPGWVPNPSVHPLRVMIETCMRDYGLVHADTAAGITLRMEPGAAQLIPALGSMTAFMRALPWSSMQRIAIGTDAVQNPLA